MKPEKLEHYYDKNNDPVNSVEDAIFIEVVLIAEEEIVGIEYYGKPQINKSRNPNEDVIEDE